MTSLLRQSINFDSQETSSVQNIIESMAAARAKAPWPLLGGITNT